uniref:Uncharacterized protein n=1 Tax=Avena sativa TaxID=4498 RepID=A0ACD6A380_AVESA
MELYPGYLDDHFSIHKLRGSAPPGGGYMPSAAAPMGIYERRHHPLAEAGAGGGGAGVWGDPFRYMASASGAAPGCGSSSSPAAAHAMELAEPKFEPPALHRTMLPQDVEALALQEAQLPHSPDSSDQEPARPGHKIQRRLAQNREAARKSRLRKKAYIQNLETSRMKLAQMEQELTRARQQQMVYAGASGSSSSHVGLPPASSFDPGVAAFEIEYAQWVEEQTRQTRELRAALQQPDAPERRLSALAEAGLEHYDRLFLAKSAAASSDVFFVMSGVWRPAAERFFLWIAGFRPSDLLKVLAPQLEPLTEDQQAAVGRLQQTARQAEDALSQGMEKLQQSLADSLLLSTAAPGEEGEGYDDGARYVGRRMASAMGRLKELAGFVEQADHLRQQTLRNMCRILTGRQAAVGLLALGDYSERLRALSTLWAARPREPV